MRRRAVALGLLLTAPPLVGFAAVSPSGPQVQTGSWAQDTPVALAAPASSPLFGSARTGAAEPARRTSSAPSCASLVATMSTRDQVGQLFVVGVSSRGMSSASRRALRDHSIGGVVLLGDTTAGAKSVARVSASVRSASRSPAGVKVMISADQEGGTVQRLRGSGFTRIPTARTQATYSNATLQARARTWGSQLRAAGVTANFTPVADVVPRGMERTNAPIGRLQRGFGPTPSVVAAKSTAVVRGMHQARVGTAVKHFPGLGRVRGNTDHVAGVVDRTTTRHDATLAGFKSAVAANTDMVMMSSATYTRIDAKRLAAFSPTVMSMLRKDLGFTGVIISDDLGSAKAVAGYAPGNRAVWFLSAGGDLVINANPGLQRAMSTAVLRKAQRDPAFATAVRGKATRVLVMKARQGLVNCR